DPGRGDPMSSVTGSGPSPSGRGDRLDRLALASARIPFRLKVAAVWVVIFAVLGGLFWLADYDTGWMRDNLTFIAGGLRFTLSIAVGGIVLAIVLATLGALGRISHNPIGGRRPGGYVS